MKTNQISKYLVLIFVFIIAPLMMYAQGGPGFPGPGDGSPGGEVPIDGGASLLVAGAAAYGYKKLREKRAGGKQEAMRKEERNNQK